MYQICFHMDALVILRFLTCINLKLVESQNCCFDNSKPYSAMGNMGSQLDTFICLVNCKSRFDFSDMLSFIFKILHDMFVRILFFVFDFVIFFIASSSTAYSICWTVIRLVSSSVILRGLWYLTSAYLWKIRIANPPYLVGKDSNLRSSSLHIRPPVIAGRNQFRMVFSTVISKLLISGIVLLK